MPRQGRAALPVLEGGRCRRHCVTEELTLPGFRRHLRVGACRAAGSPMLRNDELRLADYGLEYIFPEIVVHMPFRTAVADAMARHQAHCRSSKFSPGRRHLRRMMAEFAAIKPVFDAASYTPVGFGKRCRAARRASEGKWQRRIAMSAGNHPRQFRHDHCRASCSGWRRRPRAAGQPISPARLVALLRPPALQLVRAEEAAPGARPTRRRLIERMAAPC